jgi:hypothetical protein
MTTPGQGSFTDRSPRRGAAVNVGVSGLVVAQHRWDREAALGILSPFDTVGV